MEGFHIMLLPMIMEVSHFCWVAWFRWVRYVDLYVNYILKDSISNQFTAFYRGFYQVYIPLL